MNYTRKSFTEWTRELNIRLFSSSKRMLEMNDFHIRKISAKEFLRKLKTCKFTFDDRNVLSENLAAFSQKYELKQEYIIKLIELRKDDYVKFKDNDKIKIGRYQGIVNNGKELVEIEVNGNGALNYVLIEKSKIKFPTRKEIHKTMKAELAARSKRASETIPGFFSNNLSYLSYYD